MPDANQYDPAAPNSQGATDASNAVQPTQAANPLTEQLITESTLENYIADALGSIFAIPLALTIKPSDMQEDGKYEKILNNLKKEKKENQKNFFDTKEGIDYLYGDFDNPDKSTVYDEAERIFRERHPKEAERYDKKRTKEEKKIHKGLFGRVDIHSDPEYLRMHHVMSRHLREREEEFDRRIKKTKDKGEKEKLKEEKKKLGEKLEEFHYRQFVKKYREKAEAYAKKDKALKETLETVQKEEAEKQKGGPAPIAPTPQSKEEQPPLEEEQPSQTHIPPTAHGPTATPATKQELTQSAPPAASVTAPTIQSTPAQPQPTTDQQPQPVATSVAPQPISQPQRTTPSLTLTTPPILPPPTPPYIPPSPSPQKEEKRREEPPQQDSGFPRNRNTIDNINRMLNRFNKFSSVGKNAETGAQVAKAGGWLGRIAGLFGGGGGGAAAAGEGVVAGGSAAAAGGPILIGVLIALGVLLIIIIIVLVVGCATKMFPCGTEEPLPENTQIAGLTLNKFTNASQVQLGDTIEYTINVFYDKAKNQDIVIKDVLPENTELVDITGKFDVEGDEKQPIILWRLKENGLSANDGTRTDKTEFVFKLLVKPTKNNVVITNTATAVIAGENGPINILPAILPEGTENTENAKNTIRTILLNNPELETIYQQAEAETGVPWQLLAGKHFVEGGSSPTKSLVSGREIGTNEPDVVRGGGCSSQVVGKGIPIPLEGGGCGFSSLLDSAIYAGNHLKNKIGKAPSTFQEAVTALSRYNGGGNSNCGNGVPYAGCPKEFEGEDDPYPLNYFDKKHDPMYLIYCADLTRCDPPQVFRRPGVMTIVRGITGQ